MHVYIFVPILALTTICGQLIVVLCYLRLRFPIVTTILCPQLCIIVQPSLTVSHRNYCAINPLYLSAFSPNLLINTVSHQINRLWRVNGRHQPVDNPDTRLLSDYARQVAHSILDILLV